MVTSLKYVWESCSLKYQWSVVSLYDHKFRAGIAIWIFPALAILTKTCITPYLISLQCSLTSKASNVILLYTKWTTDHSQGVPENTKSWYHLSPVLGLKQWVQLATKKWHNQHTSPIRMCLLPVHLHVLVLHGQQAILMSPTTVTIATNSTVHGLRSCEILYSMSTSVKRS